MKTKNNITTNTKDCRPTIFICIGSIAAFLVSFVFLAIIFKQSLSSLGPVEIKHDHDLAYFGSILIFAIIIRAFLSLFKACAVRQGEADGKTEDLEVLKNNETKYVAYIFSDRLFWVSYRENFLSCGGHRNLDDYWLPFFIGVFELMTFPIFIALDRWYIIGAWVGIKSAVHLGSWKNVRATYNRYLLGVILPIVFSIYLTSFINPSNCNSKPSGPVNVEFRGTANLRSAQGTASLHKVDKQITVPAQRGTR